MLSRTGNAETITAHYLFALGSYRALYIVNWIYRYVFKAIRCFFRIARLRTYFSRSLPVYFTSNCHSHFDFQFLHRKLLRPHRCRCRNCPDRTLRRLLLLVRDQRYLIVLDLIHSLWFQFSNPTANLRCPPKIWANFSGRMHYTKVLRSACLWDYRRIYLYLFYF